MQHKFFSVKLLCICLIFICLNSQSINNCKKRFLIFLVISCTFLFVVKVGILKYTHFPCSDDSVFILLIICSNISHFRMFSQGVAVGLLFFPKALPLGYYYFPRRCHWAIIFSQGVAVGLGYVATAWRGFCTDLYLHL